MDVIASYLDKTVEMGSSDLERKKPVGAFINYTKFIPYGDINRFERALRFIMVARSESFLPSKITSYISSLETLLSTSTTELKFQVSERATRLLGGEFEDKLSNFNIIGEAYDARSAYVHGSQLGIKYRNDRDKLVNLSVELDKLTRKLVKVLFSQYPELATMEQQRLGNWFKELILK